MTEAAAEARHTSVRLQNVTLDLRRRELSVGGQVVDLPPKVFDLLVLFLSEPWVVHGREELFRRVWPDVIVEQGSLNQAIFLLRRALGEQRRDCLRTVSKSGYIFEPWADIEWSSDQGRAPEAQAVLADPNVESLSPRRRSLYGWSAPLLILMGVLFGPVLWKAIWNAHDSSHATPPRSSTVSIGLVRMDAPEEDAELALAVALLEDWIHFSLNAFPGLFVLSEAEHASAPAFAPEVTVVLSAARASGQASPGISLRALVRSRSVSSKDPLLSTTEAAGSLDAAIAALADQVLEQVSESGHRKSGMTYTLGVGARAYAEGLLQQKKRQWRLALESFQAALKESPQSAIIRFRIAQVLAAQGEKRLAAEQFTIAVASLGPVAPEVSHYLHLLQGEAHAVSVAERERLKDEYTRLAQQHPERPDFQLAKAHHALNSGAPQEAVQAIQSYDWRQTPPLAAVQATLVLCEAQLALGIFHPALECAREAEQAAQALGAHATWHLATAKTYQALAALNLDPDRFDPAVFEDAAEAFAAAGYEVEALGQRARAAVLRAPDMQSAMKGAEPALQAARRTGWRSLELHLHQILNEKASELGDKAAERAQRAEVVRVASATGDRQTLARARVIDGLTSHREGRLEEFDIALGDLRSMELDGDTATMMYLLLTRRWLDQGRGVELDALMEEAWGRIVTHPEAHATPFAVGMLAQARAFVAMRRGQLPDAELYLAAARQHLPPYMKPNITSLQASLELMRGEVAQSGRLLGQAIELAANDAHFETQAEGRLHAGMLLTRLGEPERSVPMLQSVLDRLDSEDDPYLYFQALVSLAEAEAALQRWDEAHTSIEAARRFPFAQDWLPSSRLELIEIADQLRSGETAPAMERLEQLQTEAVKARDHVTLSAAALLRARMGADPAANGVPGLSEGLYEREAAWLIEAVGER
jgi:DNA-binding winged helix-turn-helix (wHTH) protein